MISTVDRLAIQLGAILWFSILLFGLLGLVVVAVLPWWMIALVACGGLILGGVGFAAYWLVYRRTSGFSTTRALVAYITGGVLAASGLTALPIYYSAYWVTTGPTSLPLATLSNGKKTIVFQGMQHVGSEDFYKSVVFDLEKALTEGYTLFFEGVQPVPGRPDLTQWFNETLRGTKKDLSAGYKQLADSCGLTFQLTYFEPLLADKAIHPSKHVTADVSYGDMKAEYERLMRDDPAFAAAMSARAAKSQTADDGTLSILSEAGKATRDQKRLIGILCRGLLGMSMAGAFGNDDAMMEKIILQYRNRELARFVAESPAEKIYITYGAAHFPGFFHDLKERDPAIKLKSLRWVRAMSLPNEAQAPLGYPITR